MCRCHFLWILSLLIFTTMAGGAEPTAEPAKDSANEAAKDSAAEATKDSENEATKDSENEAAKDSESEAAKDSAARPAIDSTAKPDEFHLHEVELKLIERTNAERARFGLRPLAISRNLVRSARRHTIYMCRSRVFAHSNMNVAENIAMGQPSVDAAIRTWMNSPGHRANILNASYSQIGVAAYRLGSNPTIYWTQQFVR